VLNERAKFDRILNVAEKYVVLKGKIEPDSQTPVFGDEIRDQIFRIENPSAKFAAIMEVIRNNLRPGFEERKFEMELIVGFLYPKLDFNVSATTNHLLKAPFNIHKGSKNLSVPLIQVSGFDIKNCLNLSDLTKEEGALTRGKGKLGHSFNDYVRKMEEFCGSLEKSRDEKHSEAEESKVDF